MSLGGLLVNLAKGILWVLRIILAAVSFVLGLCSCFVPWRIPSLTHYCKDVKNINDFTVVGFCLMGCSLLDVLTSILFVLTLPTWRMPRMFSKFKNHCEFPGSIYKPHNREAVLTSFGYFLSDLPFIFMAILTHIAFWRIILLWGKIRHSPDEWKNSVWDVFKIAVTDIPCGIVAILLVLIPWRLRKAIRLTNKKSDDEYAWKKVVLIQFAKGLTELILVPFMIPVLLTGYRVKNTWNLLKKLQDTDEEDSSERCDIKLSIMREGCMVFIDFGCLILVILTVFMVLRISALIHFFRNKEPGKPLEQPRKEILRNFLLSFRELLALLVYFVLLACPYRFWFAFSSTKDASSSAADPRPHTVVSTMRVEYPSEGGIKIHLCGTKLANLQFKTAKLYIKGDDFWKALGGMSTIAKTFLPLKLGADVLKVEDFCTQDTEFETTLHFKVAKEKVFRKHITETVGSSQSLHIAVEFDNQSGTLFDLTFVLGELLRGPEHSVTVSQPVFLFDSSQTSDALRSAAKKVPGQLVCDVMAMPAFIQFGFMLVDFLALFLFIALHLVPTRVYTLYRRILLGNAEAIARDKLIAARNKLAKALRRRPMALGSASQIIDKRAKDCNLGCFRITDSHDNGFSYYYYRPYYSGEEKNKPEIYHFVKELNKATASISSLQLEEATSLLKAFEAFTTATTTAMSYYAVSVAEHYRLTHGSKCVFTGSDTTTARNLDSILSQLWSCDDRLELDVVSKGGKNTLRTKATTFTAQRAYLDYVKAQTTADETFSALLKELDKPISAGSLSCKRFSPPAVKSEVFRTTKEFGMDVAALLAAILVACTVYRLPVMLKELYNCRSGEVRKTIYSNLGEIPIDFLYLLKALVVIAFLRNAIPMLTDVLQQGTEKKSFAACRRVVDHYLYLTAYDIHLLLAFVLCWNTIAWGMGCAVFGFLLPGVMFTWVLFGKPGEGCCETLSVLLGTAWFYGFPIVAGVTLLGDGNQTAVFGAIFGVLALFLFIFTVSWIRTTEAEELEIVHGIFLRWNWFNGLQFAYTTVECIQMVGLLVLSYYKDGSTDLSDFVYDFFKASLVYFPEEGTMSITIALCLAMTFYFVAAVPVTALAVESNAQIVTHNGWVFLMELLSQGCLPLIIYQLTDYVMCEPAEFCWSGEHRRLGTFTLLVLVFYIIASYAKPPEYTTSHCNLLDCVFVEGYAQVAKYSLIGVTIVSVALRDNTSMVFVAVAIHCVWTLFWTMAYPRVFSVSRVCSSDFYTWFKIVGYSAVLIVCSFIQHGIAGLAISGGVVLISCAISYKFGFAHDDDMRRSPEQLQSDLLTLYEDLKTNDCLAKSFTESKKWKGSVKGCIRVSQLAGLIVQLEESILYQHLDPMFLTMRPGWKSSLSKYITSEDTRGYFDDDDYYYGYYWWDPCLHFFLGFLCCWRSMTGFSSSCGGTDELNDKVANTPEAFADLHTKFQQLRNGVQLVVAPQGKQEGSLPSDSEPEEDEEREENESVDVYTAEDSKAIPDHVAISLNDRPGTPSQDDHPGANLSYRLDDSPGTPSLTEAV
eukprot:TRINITY_DN6976_c0_g3_i2.p1 TRINITY_DN6976_c0_g3~~TRINITY_DN6976_c0_g3_i2.p1  ORF type:complete len:1544 (+),score=194.48 TRINITY_DN6976_c0_g3_i2:62-4693(+)